MEVSSFRINNLKKLYLLIWKDVLIQVRHPQRTIVGFVIPFLLCIFLLYVRGLVQTKPHPDILYEPFVNGIPILQDIKNLNVIAWSPWNSLIENISQKVVEAIAREGNIRLAVYTFTSSSTMNAYFRNELNLYKILAGIQLDDSLLNASAFPRLINVRLRFPSELRNNRPKSGYRDVMDYTWKAHLLFPHYLDTGPRKWSSNEGGEPSYYYEGFLKLQQEISFAIINHLTQQFKDTEFNSVPLMMQRFPYPKWTEDRLLPFFHSFVGILLLFAFFYPSLYTIKFITAEREKELKGAMTSMGLSNWLHWCAWFIKSLALFLIIIIVMTISMKINWFPSGAILKLSNPVAVFVFLVVYAFATITYCFLIGVLFSKVTMASIVACLIWWTTYVPYMMMQANYDDLTLLQKLFSCLSFNAAMSFGFRQIFILEGEADGLQWYNIWNPPFSKDKLTMGHLMMVLLLDAVLYFCITLYIEQVSPGYRKAPLPWYFPFTQSFWCGASKYRAYIREHTRQDQFFQKKSTQLQTGIVMRHLKKEYANHNFGVDDLTLNIYKNQITVLLGCKASGKTTTLSILCGLIAPSSGTAIVGGYKIRGNMKKIRKILGFCPQHNILFDELTIREHLFFYTRAKGLFKEEVDQEIDKYFKLLLLPKTNELSVNLSNDVKRKLSVALALCGNSSIVLLDEPTAGVDIGTKRLLWDVLQNEKQGRTILLTSTFVDEAEMIGDQIAILARGKLQCCGSSTFLKKMFNVGYHLIIQMSPNCIPDAITTLLRQHIPELETDNSDKSYLKYHLLEKDSSMFEMLLNDIEINKTRLAILNYRMSLLTMEEVFLRVSNHNQQQKTSFKSYHFSDSVPTMNREESRLYINTRKLRGWPRMRVKFVAMFLKRGLLLYRSWLLLIVQNSIAIALLIIATILFRKLVAYKNLPELKIGLNYYANPRAVLTYAKNNEYYKRYIMTALSSVNNSVIDWGANNLTLKYLQQARRNVKEIRHRYIVGASFKKNLTTAWFDGDSLHSAPLALQLVLNSILKTEVSNDYQIQFYNYPLPFTVKTKFLQLIEGKSIGFEIAYYTGVSMALISPSYILFYIRERVNQAKHLQFLYGVGVVPFWGASFVCDMVVHLQISVCIIVTLLLLNEDGLTESNELGLVFLLLFCFGFSMLPLLYLASHLFQRPIAGYVTIAFINIFAGMFIFYVTNLLKSPAVGLMGLGKVIHWFFLLIPAYSLTVGILDMHQIYSVRRICEELVTNCLSYNLPFLGEISNRECEVRICKAEGVCCEPVKSYYSWNSPGLGGNIVFSLSLGVILFIILMLLEQWHYLLREFSCIPDTYLPRSAFYYEREDGDVEMERKKVMNMNLSEIKTFSVVTRKLSKHYNDCFAVNGITFGVHKRECFGLLGLHKAGKTTALRMLTGDVKPSSGDIWVNGLNMVHMKKIRRQIGYCTQFDGLMNHLTCRETLLMFSLLRGLTINDANVVAEHLAYEFNFQKHLNDRIKILNSSIRRKLSAAVALTGDPKVVFLDEPTTGVDPISKQHIWNVLRKVRNTGKTIILSTQSLEECEKFCSRLAIMVNGRIMYLGSMPHLRKKFSVGYTLIVKAQTAAQSGKLKSSPLNDIENFVKTKFPKARIRDRYQERMTFYIESTTLSWPEMFGVMEEGKRTLSIQSYILGQCDLEQVFMSLMKVQRND